MTERVRSLIEKTIDELTLDLSGLVVLTEAASGWYAATPVIAKMAGADRVLAVGRDSHYGALADVKSQIGILADLCGVTGIEICAREPAAFAQADIVANLGFVRPIDAQAVSWMKSTAVVPLMMEAWEIRPEDVDIAACRQKGIPVLATNEKFWQFLDYCAWLAVKLLLEAGIEIHRSKVDVVGSDRVADAVRGFFEKIGVFNSISPDAIVVSNWDGVTPLGLPPEIPTICLAVNGKMSKTLAYLGPRPVVELHVMGLKVGEELARAVRQGLTGRLAEKAVLAHCDFAQEVF